MKKKVSNGPITLLAICSSRKWRLDLWPEVFCDLLLELVRAHIFELFLVREHWARALSRYSKSLASLVLGIKLSMSLNMLLDQSSFQPHPVVHKSPPTVLKLVPGTSQFSNPRFLSLGHRAQAWSSSSSSTNPSVVLTFRLWSVVWKNGKISSNQQVENHPSASVAKRCSTNFQLPRALASLALQISHLAVSTYSKWIEFVNNYP